MKHKLAMFSLFICSIIYGQSQTKRVLFLGNSYTFYNSLPQLVSNMTGASGRTLITDNNTVGGYTLNNHLSNATSLSKIQQGQWDYVVIQEQSQIPTIDYYRYNFMYPSGIGLRDSIKKYNPCATIITYMTWGRRYGGQQCDGTNTYCSPVFTDFNHMQDSLTSAYEELADLIGAQDAPVGVAWKNVLNSSSYVLHVSDNSHPSLEGSYIAACVIYSAIWKMPSLGNTYTSGLPAATALFFQQMSDSTVFNSTSNWNLNIDNPRANFTFSNIGGSQFVFTNNSYNASNSFWDFGDGITSADTNPSHTYTTTGNFQVKLTAIRCSEKDSTTQTINVGILPVNFYGFNISANNEIVKLFWKVGVEINIIQYDIQSSSNGVDFKTIATIKSNGSKSYSWIDNSLLNGRKFYRIVAKSTFGNFTMSQVLTISNNRKEVAILVAPNPIINRIVNLQLHSIAVGKVHLDLYNSQAQKVFSTTIQYNGGMLSKSLEIPYGVTSGIYCLRATISGGQVSNQLVYVR